jgi:hypothetical protein
MAINVSFGGVNDFDSVIYAPTHAGTLKFLENQVNNVINYSQTLTDAGKSFFSDARNLFDSFNGAEAMRLARLAAAKLGNVFRQDTIQSLWDISAIQAAQFNMQRWIMANPDVRSVYQDQRCDGYSDSYVDMFPGDIKHSHYDYRQVMDGMPVSVVDEDGVDNYCVSFYMEDPIEGDTPLALDQKLDILSTWKIVSSLMEQGDNDPTSAYGGKL